MRLKERKALVSVYVKPEELAMTSSDLFRFLKTLNYGYLIDIWLNFRGNMRFV